MYVYCTWKAKNPRDLVKEKGNPGPNRSAEIRYFTRIQPAVFDRYVFRRIAFIDDNCVYLFRINRFDASPLSVDDVSFSVKWPVPVDYRLSTRQPRRRRWSPPSFVKEKHRQSFRIRWCRVRGLRGVIRSDLAQGMWRK